MGSGSVVWGGLSVSGGGDWGCGGDGGCSVMMVDGVVSGSGSSWICMIGVARAIERVWGMVDEMGWGFRTLLGEIPILSFLSHWLCDECNTKDFIDILTCQHSLLW
jgi:hypothetical protein